MYRLVRSVVRSEWGNIQKDSEIPADAITKCLKTTKNTLSVWEIKNDDEFFDAVIALASNFTREDSLHFVCINPHILNLGGVAIEKTEAPTKYEGFKDRHRDLSLLNFYTLGAVAEAIKDELVNSRERQIKWKVLKKILNDAIKDEKIRREDLNENLLKKLDE